MVLGIFWWLLWFQRLNNTIMECIQYFLRTFHTCDNSQFEFNYVGCHFYCLQLSSILPSPLHSPFLSYFPLSSSSSSFFCFIVGFISGKILLDNFDGITEVDSKGTDWYRHKKYQRSNEIKEGEREREWELIIQLNIDFVNINWFWLEYIRVWLVEES